MRRRSFLQVGMLTAADGGTAHLTGGVPLYSALIDDQGRSVMTNPYPIPRQVRQTDVLVGNGGKVYGPFDGLQIFDNEDIVVYSRASVDAAFEKMSVTVAKVSGLSFDYFTIEFVANIPETTEFVVSSERVAERSAGVKKGTTLDMTALEKELSKQASVQQELRRDIDRSLKVQFNHAPTAVPGPQNNRVLAWNEGILVNIAPSEFVNDAGFATADQGFKADSAVQPYGSAVAVPALDIPEAVNLIRTNGYNQPGDYGQAAYRLKAAIEADEIGDLVSNGGTKRWGLAETVVTPYMFGAIGNGVADDTTPLNNARDFAIRRDVGLSLFGRFGCTKLKIDTTEAQAHLRINAGCALVAVSGAAQDALLEIIEFDEVTIVGHIHLEVGYRQNYACGLWIHGSQSQFIFAQTISVFAARRAYRVGDKSVPNAVISEMTLFGGGTYGCPIVFQVEGTETFITVVGPQWVSDDFGGDASWQALPKRGIVAIGAYVTVLGGEVIMPGATDGYLNEIQPLVGTAGEGLVWGAIRYIGVSAETASPFAVTTNPDGLTGTSLGGSRGLILADACLGFHSQNAAPFIQTSVDFVGDVVLRSNRFWCPVARTQPNVQAGSIKTLVFTDDAGLGPNFEDPISGVSGGLLKFSSRQILNVIGVSNARFPASSNTDVLFSSVLADVDLARWQSSYSVGVFTVPAGGLNDLEISAQLYVSGVTNGRLIIQSATAVAPTVFGEIAAVPFSGVGQVFYKAKSFEAGTKFKVTLVATSGSGAPAAGGYLHRLTVDASR